MKKDKGGNDRDVSGAPGKEYEKDANTGNENMTVQQQRGILKKARNGFEGNIDYTEEGGSVIALIVESDRETGIPKVLEELQHLSSISVEMPELKKIPKWIYIKRTLRSLSMRDCGLQGQQPLDLFNQLEKLDLSDNQLHMFPIPMRAITTLKHVDVRNNSIMVIPDSIYEMKNLEYLDLSSNEIAFIPESIRDLKNLRVFKLGGNPVTSDHPSSLMSIPFTEMKSIFKFPRLGQSGVYVKSWFYDWVDYLRSNNDCMIDFQDLIDNASIF